MHVLVAPDKFKGSLSAQDAAAAIAEGWRSGSSASLDLEISCRPAADGGEGTAKAICEALDGSWVSCMVRDPLGRPVAAKYALVSRGGAKTAIIDMSEAFGLWRVAADERCVERQSTYGTGEMLTHALRCGKADRVMIGLGGGALRMTAVWGSPRRSVFVFWTEEDLSWSRFRRICLDSKW